MTLLQYFLKDFFLINGLNKKYLLKESFKEFFPKNFLEKSKRGFAVPVGNWLRTIFKNELINYSEESFLNEQAIFNSEYIRNIIKEHLNNKIDHTYKLRILLFSKMVRKHLFKNEKILL